MNMIFTSCIVQFESAISNRRACACVRVCAVGMPSSNRENCACQPRFLSATVALAEDALTALQILTMLNYRRYRSSIRLKHSH